MDCSQTDLQGFGHLVVSLDSDAGLILVNNLRSLLAVVTDHGPGPLCDGVQGEGHDVIDEDNGLYESQDSVTQDTHFPIFGNNNSSVFEI